MCDEKKIRVRPARFREEAPAEGQDLPVSLSPCSLLPAPCSLLLAPCPNLESHAMNELRTQPRHEILLHTAANDTSLTRKRRTASVPSLALQACIRTEPIGSLALQACSMAAENASFSLATSGAQVGQNAIPEWLLIASCSRSNRLLIGSYSHPDPRLTLLCRGKRPKTAQFHQ